MTARQRQQGGDESTNLQAGRDLTVQQGLSLEEAREVALDVFRKNFLDLKGIAEEVALARAEMITNDFLAELQKRMPAGIDNATDPDFQQSVFTAQREYACSGEADLEEALVDLLVDRAGQQGRGMQAIVLNEAISAAPKLTATQRRAVAACFLIRYTGYLGGPSLDLYFERRIRQQLLPVAKELPSSRMDYQHIEYVGAGAIGMGALSLEDALLKGGPGFFTRGFSVDEVPEPLRGWTDDSRVFIPCSRNRDHIQLRAMREDDLDQLAALVEIEDGREALLQLLARGQMTKEEVRQDVSQRVPEAQKCFEAWEESELKHLSLTSVGIAIGHGYWRRVTGADDVPLSIWIP